MSTVSVELNKMKHFKDLGFDEYEAVLMAEEDYDWHEIEKLIKNDCPHHLAQRICAPLHSIYRSI